MRSKTGNVESGRDATATLCPDMLKSPQLRWAFVCKVYAILLAQLLLTAGVASAVILMKPVSRFFTETLPGFVFSIVYMALAILALILIHTSCAYHKRYREKSVLRGLFTVAMAFMSGLNSALSEGKIVSESAILTSIVVAALTLYTFWAAKRGSDFRFLRPFLRASLQVVVVFAPIQMLFPLGKLSSMIYGCVGATVFATYIVYNTSNLIKRRLSNKSIVRAANSLYLVIICLFLSFLDVFRAG